LHILAAVPVAVWLGLLFFRGGFWRADQWLDGDRALPDPWPSVVAVVPARDEAPTVGRAVTSLLTQDYPGPFSVVVVVDDASRDGTADAARAAAAGDERLTVVAGGSLPKGWMGKLWAMQQGLEAAVPGAAFVLFTDADIEHESPMLRRLVAKAEGERLDLVSLMALLRCRSPWERLLVPAFVFFFQKLYPFPLVNDSNRRPAAAAGGCMLAQRQALDHAGGLDAIHDRLIDDCALAALLKNHGPIWIGLTRRVHSLRPYDRLGELWMTVTRTAFKQLGHSWIVLVATVLAMGVIYLVPPLAVLSGLESGDPWLVGLGLAAWLMMAAAYRPTLDLYGRPGASALFLPLSALMFTLMTIDSARRHLQGRGGAWKGRRYGAADVSDR